jgi:DNA-binding MarR family transcriptional regulator
MDDNDLRRQLISQIIAGGQKIARLAHLNQSAEEWLNLDVTLAQIKVVMCLYLVGEMNMVRLATMLGVKLPSVTGLVDRLVERGLVKRADSPGDRRLVLVSTTTEGRALIDRIWDAGWLRLDQWLESTPVEDLQIVAQAMAILSAAALTELKGSSAPHYREYAGIGDELHAASA